MNISPVVLVWCFQSSARASSARNHEGQTRAGLRGLGATSGSVWRAPKFDRVGETTGVDMDMHECSLPFRFCPALQQVEPAITMIAKTAAFSLRESCKVTKLIKAMA
jgi:hypothetical protein